MTVEGQRAWGERENDKSVNEIRKKKRTERSEGTEEEEEEGWKQTRKQQGVNNFLIMTPGFQKLSETQPWSKCVKLGVVYWAAWIKSVAKPHAGLLCMSAGFYFQLSQKFKTCFSISCPSSPFFLSHISNLLQCHSRRKKMWTYVNEKYSAELKDNAN